MNNHCLNPEQFKKLISEFPSLQGKLRNGYAAFVPFEADVANRMCASSYVIPFVSDTDCLMTRRENGQWVLPGGTLEAGETWIEAGNRELLEETGSLLNHIHAIGMYRCVSQADVPPRPHLPHPEHVRVVSWAHAKQVKRPSDPDIKSKIAEVRVVHYTEAKSLFGSESPDFGGLYEFAYRAKQLQK